jgi:hypothetical protein
VIFRIYRKNLLSLLDVTACRITANLTSHFFLTWTSRPPYVCGTILKALQGFGLSELLYESALDTVLSSIPIRHFQSLSLRALLD